MSYYQGPPGGQPPYQQQPYGGGWQQGPPPPGQGYPPPQQQWGQQGPPMNQQGWQQQPYPPQGGYPPPGQQPYGQGPPPPQQGWQQQQYPPQGGYPGPGQPYGQGPPPPGGPGGYGQQPNYGAPPGAPTPPSPGYIPGRSAPDSQHFNAASVAAKLRGAMKGIGTDESTLITNLAKLSPEEVFSVRAAYRHVDKHKERDLMKDVHGETSGYFREGLLAIIRGPLEQDCHSVHEAIKGIGTKESALNDVLLSRSNADMNAIKQKYHQMYGHSLESDVKGDLSLKTERLFDMVMAARRNEETAPVTPQQVDADVHELYQATEGRTGADQIIVSQVLSSRSDPQIRAISQAYKQKYHRSLEQVLRKEFSGHMEQAFIYMLHHAEDPAKLDADLLEETMAGAGTKDNALVRRIIAVHWNPERLKQCKAAYKHFYHRELAQRIQGETSGDYEKLMVECISEHRKPNFY